MDKQRKGSNMSEWVDLHEVDLDSPKSDIEFMEYVGECFESFYPESERQEFSVPVGKRMLRVDNLKAQLSDLGKILQGFHGGLEYEEYQRFVGIVGRSVMDAGKKRADETMSQATKYADNTFFDFLRQDKTLHQSFGDAIADPETARGRESREYFKNAYLENFHDDGLAMAAARGDISIMRFHFDQGGDVNGNKTWNPDRPLFMAVRNGQVEAFKVLLGEFGANMDLISSGGIEPGLKWADDPLRGKMTLRKSLLSVAALYNQPEMFELVMQNKADPKSLLTDHVYSVGRNANDINEGKYNGVFELSVYESISMRSASDGKNWGQIWGVVKAACGGEKGVGNGKDQGIEISAPSVGNGLGGR